MNTRKKVTLWPFEKSVVDEFLVNKPPTNQDVLLRFFSIHEDLQLSSKRQSTKRAAAEQTVKEITDWWVRAGYLCLSKNTLINKLLKLDDQEKKLRQDNNKIASKIKKLTPAIQKKQDQFISLSKQTFWAVTLDYENYLKENAEHSTNQALKEKCAEDLKFLLNMKSPDRVGALGPLDTSLTRQQNKTNKRKFRQRKDDSTGTNRTTDVTETATTISRSDESECGTDHEEDPTFKSPKKKKIRSKDMSLRLDKDTLLKASLSADVNGLSVRKQLRYTAALLSAGGADIDRMSLSKSTIHRDKQTARNEKAFEIKNNYEELLMSDEGYWVVHWDGKTLKQTTHAGHTKSVLAVVLNALHSDNEVLLDVIDVSDSTGSFAEFQALLKSLQDAKANLSKIVGCVFDTTATNSGLNNGVVVQLQTALGHPLFQLACRHHLLELVCGSICKNVFGGTTESPVEPTFKQFAAVWSTIDKANYHAFVFRSRKLQRLQESALLFFQDWLDNEASSRGDYLELVELAILILGGENKPTKKPFSFKAPGAVHHARWMAKVLYTFKIALFNQQLLATGFASEKFLTEMLSLASFLALFYVKHWCTACQITNAAVNDLQLWKDLGMIKSSDQRTLKSYPTLYYDFAVSAQKKLQNHMWYLSERNVVFSLFSNQVSISEKVAIWRKLKDHKVKQNKGTVGKGLIKMPEIRHTTHIKDLIGQDSYAIAELIPSATRFLQNHPKEWAQNPDYITTKKLIEKLPCINDAAERALSLVTNVHLSPSAPKLRGQQELLVTVKHEYNQKLKKHAQNAIQNRDAASSSKTLLRNFNF